MHPDSIGVVIVMDGIEKVNPDMIGYFEELERESGIYLSERDNPSYNR